MGKSDFFEYFRLLSPVLGKPWLDLLFHKINGMIQCVTSRYVYFPFETVLLSRFF